MSISRGILLDCDACSVLASTSIVCECFRVNNLRLDSFWGKGLF